MRDALAVGVDRLLALGVRRITVRYRAPATGSVDGFHCPASAGEIVWDLLTPLETWPLPALLCDDAGFDR